MVKQVGWHRPSETARTVPVYRDSEADSWKFVGHHPCKVPDHKLPGIDVTPGFATFQKLLALGYVAVTTGLVDQL